MTHGQTLLSMPAPQSCRDKAVSGACNPFHIGFGHKRGDERAPHGGHLGAAVDGDSAEKGRCMGRACKRGTDEIGRPAH